MKPSIRFLHICGRKVACEASNRDRVRDHVHEHVQACGLEEGRRQGDNDRAAAWEDSPFVVAELGIQVGVRIQVVAAEKFENLYLQGSALEEQSRAKVRNQAGAQSHVEEDKHP